MVVNFSVLDMCFGRALLASCAFCRRLIVPRVMVGLCCWWDKQEGALPGTRQSGRCQNRNAYLELICYSESNLEVAWLLADS